jgi:hypothetical protein
LYLLSSVGDDDCHAKSSWGVIEAKARLKYINTAILRLWLIFVLRSLVSWFGLTQLWSWMQQFALQQPAFIVGGVGLAMASNWQRRAAFPFDMLHQWLEDRSVKLAVERGDSPLASNLDHDGVKKADSPHPS